MTTQHFDVLILGAGIAGISAACHLERHCPAKRYAVLERRADLGGTWDLFRYPGLRSDSSMQNYGFGFRLWKEPRILSDGASIKRYLRDTADEYGVENKIRYGLKIERASWSSEQHRWTVEVCRESDGSTEIYTANFLSFCTGYYDQDRPYRPTFNGEERFSGRIIHPQHWPDDLDVAGKRVVIIGSGATAMTLVPALAGKVSHVTMLQRSPTYLLSVPAIDHTTALLHQVLPSTLAYRIARTRNMHIENVFYFGARRNPKVVRRLLLANVRRQLRGVVDMKHFTPEYAPWDQRVCVLPNGDLFKALHSGEASIVTDHIDTLTESGIQLKSGEVLAADIIVSATGLNLQMFGGIALVVDNVPVETHERMLYKGMMLEGLPNHAFTIGYTNFSWTLKADMVSDYTCRLLNHMEQQGYDTVIAQDRGNCVTEEPIFNNMNSGYFKRAANSMPRQGSRFPWLTMQDIAHDSTVLRHGPIEDGIMAFDGELSRAGQRSLLGRLPRSIRFAVASIN